MTFSMEYPRQHAPAVYLEEIPTGVGTHPIRRDRSHLLPVGAPGGTKLVSYEPDNERGDPAVIQDRFGHILHQWPDGYTPDYVDVMAACKKLGW